MPCYLVEWYRPALSAEAVAETAARLRASAETLSANGIAVRLLTLLSVPADEVVFGVFTADSAAQVARTCEGAQMPAQRVTAATDVEFCGP